jgi:hypothetical protein
MTNNEQSKLDIVVDTIREMRDGHREDMTFIRNELQVLSQWRINSQVAQTQQAGRLEHLELGRALASDLKALDVRLQSVEGGRRNWRDQAFRLTQNVISGVLGGAITWLLAHH